MNRRGMNALKATAWTALVVVSLVSPAYGQRRTSVGDYYGGGPEGTIGRGTDRLPGGPSDWGGGGFWNSPAYGYSYGYGSGSSSYSAPRPSPAPAAAAPYLTTRYYEPGDGYRYPLYFNPVTRAYLYYPVTNHPKG